MTERDALLAGILAVPEDDTARLVFADWLDEHDEPERAEFIRVQCRSSSIRDELRALNAVRPFLTAAFPSPKPDCYEWGFYSARNDDGTADDFTISMSRGFALKVTCPAATFLRIADALIWHPTQTVECPGCARCRKTPGRFYTGKDGMKWLPCRAPRPCPPTAEPVRQVRLTTWPGAGLCGFDYRGVWFRESEIYPWKEGEFPVPAESNRHFKRAFEGRWKGIEFALPSS